MSLQTFALATFVVAAGALQYTLVFQALRDLVQRPRVRGGNKMTWALLILCLPVAGAFLYSSMGPTSLMRQGHAGPGRQAPPKPRREPVKLSGPMPQNVTPFRSQSSAAVRGRTTARRSGLTHSRAHNTGALKPMRRTGS